MTNPTQLAHYAHFPMCGFCTQAWDILYGRMRSSLSPDMWLNYCKWGGCDPDIYDYLDEQTGWPKGWKLGADNRPVAYFNGKYTLTIPDTDNRVFHKRADNGPGAPWRSVVQKLRATAIKRAEVNGPVNVNDAFDEDDDDEVIVEQPASKAKVRVKVTAVSLDDEDLWD